MEKINSDSLKINKKTEICIPSHIDRNHDQVRFCITRFFSGLGVFGSYSHQFQIRSDPWPFCESSAILTRLNGPIFNGFITETLRVESSRRVRRNKARRCERNFIVVQNCKARLILEEKMFQSQTTCRSISSEQWIQSHSKLERCIISSRLTHRSNRQ